MEMTVKPSGSATGVQFVAETRGHSIIVDQPKDNGGEDAGMTPPELLLASLGTCAGHYALQYLKARSIPFDGVSIRVVAEKAMGPARLDGFKIEVAIPAGLETRHHEGLHRAIEKCLIHNTMLHKPTITVALTGAVNA